MRAAVEDRSVLTIEEAWSTSNSEGWHRISILWVLDYSPKAGPVKVGTAINFQLFEQAVNNLFLNAALLNPSRT
jgi:hypothetical protein